MSRYNGRHDLTKPFEDVVFVVVVVPIALSCGLVAYTYWRLLHDHETAVQRVQFWTCETTGGHNWADEHDYGVEPVCLFCGTERDRDAE